MLYSLKTAATNPSICSNRHSTDADITLVRSGLDFGNAVLMGLPTYLLRRVQSVQNAAEQLIYRLHSLDHIHPHSGEPLLAQNCGSCRI